MKGVCLVAADAPGGIGSYVRVVGRGLRADHPDRPVLVLDSRGGRAARWPLTWLGAVLRLAHAACSGRISVVHLMASERSSLWRKGGLALVGRMLGLAVIVHHHGAEMPALARAGRPFDRLGLALVVMAAHRHLVLGEAWRDALLAAGAAPEAVEILRNALPDRPPPVRTRAQDRPIRLLFLGEISRRKGAVTVMEALAALARDGVAFEARIAGDGPERRALEARAPEVRGPAPCTVAFLGRVAPEAAEALMGWADLLLHPSTHEGLPMALLEAMRAGLPAVASPVGAIAEAIPDGDGLMHVAPGESRALAAAVRRLAVDHDRRHRLGEAGRRAFEARFRLGRHLDRLAELYGWRPVEAPQGRGGLVEQAA